MNSKIKVILYFVLRPKYWKHFIFSKIKNKIFSKNDKDFNKQLAIKWAEQNKNDYIKILLQLNNNYKFFPDLDKKVIEFGKKQSSKSPIQMGGPGDIKLLYGITKITKANRVIETGVAYGWSSLAILKAISENNENGRLISVDMPYPGKYNDKFVGIVVPENLRVNWKLIRKPDRPGIKEAIKLFGGEIDLCHYDSDKSWWGRDYAYPILWEALKKGGIFISDDIQDNLYFANFVKLKKCKFFVIKKKNGIGFVGLAIK